MASITKQTQTIRDHKLHTRGRKRKNKVDRVGTTRSAKELFAKKPAAKK